MRDNNVGACITSTAELTLEAEGTIETDAVTLPLVLLTVEAAGVKDVGALKDSVAADREAADGDIGCGTVIGLEADATA